MSKEHLEEVNVSYLEYYFFRGLICLQEMANIHKCPLFAGCVFSLKMIPPKLYQFLPMMDKIILKIFKKQGGKLQ